MNLDWHWLQGKMEQDEAVEKFEKAVESYERAKDEYEYWRNLSAWALWYSIRKN